MSGCYDPGNRNASGSQIRRFEITLTAAMQSQAMPVSEPLTDNGKVRLIRA